MEEFFWRGIDKFGQDKKGILQAESPEHLKDLLLQNGIALLSCQTQSKNNFNFNWFSKISLNQKSFFFQQLAVLINSGIELLQALRLLSKQVKSKKLQNIINQLMEDVAKGDSLSIAMQKHESTFATWMINVIKSGENSGELGLVLQNLADYLNDRLILYKKIKQAATLPLITLIFAMFIIWGVFVFIVPQFEMLFSSMDKELPASTQFIMNVSSFLRSKNSLIALIVFLILLLFLKFIFSIKSVKNLKDKFVLNIFYFGRIVLLFDLISFLQIFSMFLRSGVALKQALELSVHTVKNTYFKEKIFLLTDLVIQGDSLQDACTKIGTKYFPDDLITFIAVGQKAGNLDFMLERVILLFQDELGNKLQFITTILQPILMILVGLLVVFLMLSVYLPIFNMASFA